MIPMKPGNVFSDVPINTAPRQLPPLPPEVLQRFPALADWMDAMQTYMDNWQRDQWEKERALQARMRELSSP